MSAPDYHAMMPTLAYRNQAFINGKYVVAASGMTSRFTPWTSIARSRTPASSFERLRSLPMPGGQDRGVVIVRVMA
jgi:hypothetical protein